MKRGFLFGLGTFLIFVVIVGLIQIVNEDRLAVGAVMLLILMPLSVFVIGRAKSAPPNRSRLHAIAGWFIGFFTIWVVPLTLLFLLWALF